jgi:FkbM family methyltransferase
MKDTAVEPYQVLRENFLRETRSKMMGKVRTALKYASIGLDLGADLRSKWILSSMLPRLRLHSTLGVCHSNIYNATIQIERSKLTVHFREKDIFIFNEVLFGNPYITPELYKEPPRYILDLGAHIGLASLRFTAAFPNAVIHCYEPDPENFELLALNTEGLRNIVLHREAVGCAIEKTFFYINGDRHTASSLKPDGMDRFSKIECSVLSLDEIIKRTDSSVDLIKFDIEGVEYEVFSCSELVHGLRHIVGEMKASRPEIERFINLFPGHITQCHQAAKNMSMIYLNKKS